MEGMSGWWRELTAVNQWFYIGAMFFSAFFLWQLIATVAGLAGGEHDLDTHAEADWQHDTPADAHDTVIAFKLLSIRGVLAFLTLFCWASALYLDTGSPLTSAMGYAVLWGATAMVLVSLALYGVQRLAETGNLRIESCVGASGTVYLDIPAEGEGEIRVLCSGVMTHVKARCPAGPLKAGQSARVVRVVGPNSVEVEPEH